MRRVRPAAVAGAFYPDDPAELAAMIDSMLAGSASASPAAGEPGPPVALVVPHAGYVYSGPVAATAYSRLVPWRATIERVVVIGPPHRVPVRGLALSSADIFATPLGDIALDTATRDSMLQWPGVYVDDRAHAPEHSIEVHLPFLQRVLGTGWLLVPALAGGIDPQTLADALEPVWGAPNTVVVISTDLSHYHDILTARRMDRATADAIVGARWEDLDSDDACGAAGVRGALEMVRRKHEQVDLLDLRNSGDTAGPADRVVGYGSFSIQ